MAVRRSLLDSAQHPPAPVRAGMSLNLFGLALCQWWYSFWIVGEILGLSSSNQTSFSRVLWSDSPPKRTWVFRGRMCYEEIAHYVCDSVFARAGF